MNLSQPNDSHDLRRPVEPVTSGPIFIIGSPRSGTSILGWCLGQHQNLLPLEESNWMAPFAVDAALAFRRGTRRGERSQLASMGMSRETFLEDFGDSVNRSILGHGELFEARRTMAALANDSAGHPAFKIRRDPTQTKNRWVNGTPEYSFGVCGLRKLFPSARFIHLLREPDQVVSSMLHFDRVAGFKLVTTEREGYQSWLRYVHACLVAEEAFGAEIVCRLFHDQLLQEPEKAIRRVLRFVDEPFAPACLEPLSKKINSSRSQPAVGTNSVPDFPEYGEARGLWEKLTTKSPPLSGSPQSVALLEEEFEKRVTYLENLGAEVLEARDIVTGLQRELREKTAWGQQLNQEVEEARGQLSDLQTEFSERTAWALQLNQQVEEKGRQLLDLQVEFDERTAWALSLRDEVARKTEAITKLRSELQQKKELVRQLRSKLSGRKARSRK